MAVIEHVEVLKAGYADQLAKVDQVKVEIEGKMSALDALVVDHEAEKKAQFDAGFEAGLAQAGQAGSTDKIYSDAEMNAELEPLKAQIAALTGQVENLVLEADLAKASVAQVQADFDAYKANVLAKLEAQLAEEAAIEQKLIDELK